MEKNTCYGDLSFVNGEVTLIDRKEIDGVGRLFKVLGDKNRLQIVYSLYERSMCVHELEKMLGISQSLVSHQLKILRDNKIVKTARRKNEIMYSLDDDHIVKLLKIAKEHIEE